MRTNLFSVKKKTDKKILIEEEKTKNPFLLFLKLHWKLIVWLLFLLFISLILVSVGIAFSLFGNSSDFDISYLNDNKDKVVTDTDTSITDEDISQELLGPVARKLGVVLLVETFMTDDNDVVYYFSDYTAIIVKADGSMYRVSPIDGDKYGVSRSGKIDDKAKKVLVKSTTSTLQDGTIIIYYSDGSARLEHNGVTLFIRDSNNIKLESGTKYVNINPSGVANSTNIAKDGNVTMYTFTDNTKYVIDNGIKYIVNPNANASNKENNISYDKNNSFKVLEEKNMKDGSKVTYFENGSAVITDKNGNNIFVKKSGDINIKNNNVYEIIPNTYGYSKTTFTTGDGKKVTYFDNGAAIITYPDGTKTYVEDNNDILYGDGKSIISKPDEIKEISKKKTTDGYNVINFDNGKSQIIKPDGSSIIVDTSKLKFDSDGNITDKNKKKDTTTTTDNKKKDDDKGKDKNKDNDSSDKDKDKDNEPEELEDPLEGLYVSDAEYKYDNDRFKNKQYTNFNIKNDNKKMKKFRIVIEEIDNYAKFNASRLEPKYVKFQATVGDSLVGPAMLVDKTWNDENGKVNYVIYDGTIGAKATLEVAVSLYVDYAMLNNDQQDKYFMGTVKVYVTE